MSLFFLLMLVPFMGICYRLFVIQFVEGDELRARAHKITVKDEVVKAKRGNVYSTDGSLLATSVRKYDIYFDAVSPKNKYFEKNISSLADSLSVLVGRKSAFSYERYLRKKRANHKRYVQIAKRLSHTEYTRLKKFPLFNLGKFRGGLIIDSKPFRQHPMGEIASRTIGYERIDDAGNVVRKGVEAAYSKYLTGTDGKRKVQKMAKGLWKPITDDNFVQPEDGLDIVSTINVYIQDIAHHALQKSLEYYGAEHGTVVVMDVKTGFVRAIANLGLSKNTAKYVETINYAVLEKQDPGSTFKLASYLALLDLNKADTSQVFDTHGGVVRFERNRVKDSKRGGYGKISLARGFEVSSNTVVTQAVNKYFKNKPLEFINKLETFGFNYKLGIDLIGEPKSFIPKPGSSNWSDIALPWMAYGYGIGVTPLQMLTLYNAVANDGEMVSPRFVEEIKKVNQTITKFDKNVINPQIAKPSVIRKMQAIMKNVVKRGTARSLYSDKFSMAGKTGTAQVNYAKGKGDMYYASSFAGYFPADNPKYSCIVVIHKPTKHSYYGADVAGPVFQRIAQKIYTDVPSVNELKSIDQALEDTKLEYQAYYKKVNNQSRLMPNVVGMSAMDAIPALENLGLKVRLIGKGKVVKQSISVGKRVGKSTQITIVLK